MTKKFNVRYTCDRCGHQATAETAFGRWMRAQTNLESKDGIVRTDCDHIILRYKTHKQGRDFQLMMVVEVKEFGAEPDPSQVDILSFLSQAIRSRGKNIHGAKTDQSLRLRSRLLGRDVRVRDFGVHLLQFEKTNPDDSRWIKWDRKLVDPELLCEILAMNVHPDRPTLPMDEFLRDRHRRKDLPLLRLGESA